MSFIESLLLLPPLIAEFIRDTLREREIKREREERVFAQRVENLQTEKESLGREGQYLETEGEYLQRERERE